MLAMKNLRIKPQSQSYKSRLPSKYLNRNRQFQINNHHKFNNHLRQPLLPSLKRFKKSGHTSISFSLRQSGREKVQKCRWHQNVALISAEFQARKDGLMSKDDLSEVLKLLGLPKYWKALFIKACNLNSNLNVITYSMFEQFWTK